MSEEQTVTEKVKAMKPNVRQLIDVDQLKKDLSYSPNDLSSAMMAQASLHVYYGVLAAKASRQVDDLEIVLSAAKARADRQVRDRASLTGNKITEGSVSKQVDVSGNVVAVMRAVNEAKQIEAMCKTAVDAFRQRRDMLVSEGMQRSAELKGEVSIRARRDAAAAGEDLRQATINRLQNKGGEQEAPWTEK